MSSLFYFFFLFPADVYLFVKKMDKYVVRPSSSKQELPNQQSDEVKSTADKSEVTSVERKRKISSGQVTD